MYDQTSYKNHHGEYSQNEAFERERRSHSEHDTEDFEYLYKDDHPHGNALDKHSLTIAVDVGSGSGWFANYLIAQRNYKIVYAIEPSQAAVDIAKKIYPDQKKVQYIVGFAEEEIYKLKLEEPTFFSTMGVFMHLPNEASSEILKAISTVAPIGSVWAASEPWGEEYHNFVDLWHIRPPEWWSTYLPGWKFKFHTECELTDPPGRYKGFTATKS